MELLCPILFFPLFPTSTLTRWLNNSSTIQPRLLKSDMHFSRWANQLLIPTPIHKTTCLPAEYKSLIPTSLMIMLLLPELSWPVLFLFSCSLVSNIILLNTESSKSHWHWITGVSTSHLLNWSTRLFNCCSLLNILSCLLVVLNLDSTWHFS